MQNASTDFDEVIKERPTFLKTLCILTFIYSSFTIITNFATALNPETTYNMIVSKKRIIENPKNQGSHSKDSSSNFSKKIIATLSGFTIDKIRQSAIGNIISSLFCFIGAFLMWKLKRFGYYVYIFGTIAAVSIPFYLFGNNFIGEFSTAAAGFFGALFIIFYGMNLKCMTN